MKKLLSLILSIALCAGFCACGKADNSPQPQPSEQTEEIPVEDDGVLKILLICNSHGTDSSFMFPDVVRNEGEENLVFGRLYHSGCRMVQHVDYAEANAAQYSYDEYDISKDDCWKRAYADGSWQDLVPGTATDTYIEDGSIAQTMQFGIQRHDWDLIIIQASTYEGAGVEDSYYVENGHKWDLKNYTQKLMDYVLSQDIEPRSVPKFAWNITWSRPADKNVWRDADKKAMDSYFGGDQNLQYSLLMKTHQEVIAPAFNFDYVMSAGTLMQNLKTTKLQSADIYRDYGHVTDFGRLAVAYLWYCTLYNKDIADCQIPSMNYKVILDKFARQYKQNMELTEERKDILVEAVANAMQTPFAMTPSQYTE